VISSGGRDGQRSCDQRLTLGHPPFLPVPDPDDLLGTGIENGKKAAEVTEANAKSAADKIKAARRIGPSRAARIAKLEKEAEAASKTAKALDAAGYIYSGYEAVKNVREYCLQ
jgi:hypothetical protein